MRRIDRSLALQLAAALLLCAAARAQDHGMTPYIEGRAARVVDGNTIVIVNSATGQQVRVLLRGTDAPELAQAHGAESRRRLESLVAGAKLRVEFKFTDKYGQVLGLVLRDGDDINLRQLEEGMAWFHTNLSNELSTEERKLYEQAERAARGAGRGLWKDKNAVAPSGFRRANNISDDPRDEPPAAPAAAPAAIQANRRTKTYFTPGCAGYARVPARLRVRFKTAEDAERAGYKPAPGCAR